VTVDDDDARWLVGDATPAAAEEPAADDLAAARRRRLSTAPDDELALGEDAIEMVADEESATETTMEIRGASLGAEQPVEAYLDDDIASDDAPSASATSGDVEDTADEAPAEPRPKPAKKRGRASVPSWDEIMFGGGKND
jgi:hypothetical protein